MENPAFSPECTLFNDLTPIFKDLFHSVGFLTKQTSWIQRLLFQHVELWCVRDNCDDIETEICCSRSIHEKFLMSQVSFGVAELQESAGVELFGFPSFWLSSSF